VVWKYFNLLLTFSLKITRNFFPGLGYVTITLHKHHKGFFVMIRGEVAYTFFFVVHQMFKDLQVQFHFFLPCFFSSKLKTIIADNALSKK